MHTPSFATPTLRALLWATCAWFVLVLVPAAQAQGKPSYTITTAQMQQAVGQRFPLRYPVGGLVDLELKTPRLRLLPAQNRLATTVDVDASGPALRRVYPGSFEIDFALRYEASDQSIRAHQIEVRSLQMEGLNPATTELLQAYLPGLVRERLREVVVHTLRPQDLALADAMGMQPDTLTVTQGGLLIGFTPKR